MLTGAVATYAAALLVIAAATAVGHGILAVSGRPAPSWAAPAIGLAAITVLAWWTVRLPGEGLTALVAVLVAAVGGGALSVARLAGLRAHLASGLPVLAIALALASVPFLVDGHFGVLGTGFNVDMSQHLFVASWIAQPEGPIPALFGQGYPLGPHALAVATAEPFGELALAFSGVTIAVPAITAATALAVVPGCSRGRAMLAAILAAFAYLAASYLAQGSFKELFEAAFLLGVVAWLRELRAGKGGSPSWLAGLPLAVLAAGALYAYSGPGLVWLAGALALWALWEVLRRRGELERLAAATLPAAVVGAVALAVLAAPELDRIEQFCGSVGTVSDRADAGLRSQGLHAERGASEAGTEDAPRFDNDLGNLFGQIDPLTALGVWPSGDFRVAPGDGAVPAPVFHGGALLAAIALALGVAAALRAGETALLVALAAAAAIWLAARLASTPYTTARALAVAAPVVMLTSVGWAVRPPGHVRDRQRLLGRAMAAAFLLAAALSSALALVNAPVGPREYTPGVTALSPTFAGSATLLLAPPEVLADGRGEDFYRWELREADPACVEPAPDRATAGPPPGGIRYVLRADRSSRAPFSGLRRRASEDGVVLWEVLPGAASGPRIQAPEPGSTDCGL